MQISQLAFVLLSIASTAFADGVCGVNFTSDPPGEKSGDCLYGYDIHGWAIFVPCAPDSPCSVHGKPCHLDAKRNIHQALCLNQKDERYPDKI
ncbi:unnamed protein product [Zymoseptoria tritici ST99CH_1A5]|uniref:Uncharacterized protein n=1 Tax=Zymoseptoria tritici ST99CH_1A5 TaxID=1276529 RepID=A0A1Y6LGJ1_ZYMTR|nr:unnamed protein product [Zymoseptoria tritici ST99CH_1A5]